METRKKSPEVRFAGFTEEWKLVAMEDLTTAIGDGIHGTPNYVNNGDVFFINGNNLKSGGIEVNNETNKVSENQMTPSDKSLSSNTILISINGTIGNIAKYRDEKVMLGKSVAYLNLKNINREYVYSVIQSPNVQAHFLNNLTGSTIKNLGLKTIRETVISLPSLVEQKKIADLFSNLDKLIENHQTQLTKLKNLKKAMLTKMFPQNGASVPEIRFKGFDGEWEKYKLSDVTEYQNGKGYESEQSSFGKYELINLNSISIDGGLKPSGKYINNAELTLKKDDLVMILSDVGHGNLLGRVALIPENNRYVLNQRVALLRPNWEVQPLFLYYTINVNQLYFKNQGAGMSQLNISKSSVEDFEFLYPTDLEEQVKISKYFTNLDGLIENHQEQLKKLNNIKKACLNKLFVS